mmetsp:Transcript_29565/g.62718  ORF Transcript_29565/g.62718 Transcript_29565/m.62718 type:complete len:448 (+) Transcript_29565:56-1399(+)
MSNPPPPVPNPMAAAAPAPPPSVRPTLVASTTPAAAPLSKPIAASGGAPAAKTTTPQQQALQQQIQAQLQSQLQAQLQAAAARGKQANITPEMIQAQAQAMVQAAAQAQAVVAAAKNRGGGLVPMNAAQIAALSQIQAQAIVNARPQTALIGSGTVKSDEKPTPQQIQNQIQLQAQALVHAHTQAQISAGIYKGGEVPPAAARPKAAPQAPLHQARVAPAQVSNPMATKTKILIQQRLHPTPIQPAPVVSQMKPNHLPPVQHPGALIPQPTGIPAATTMSLMAPAAPRVVQQTNYMSVQASAGAMVPAHSNLGGIGEDGLGGVVMPATSPEFLAKLNECLTDFWAGQLQEMRILGTDKVQTEQDFKNHNDLPLARIKRIMKSDEDVRMISAEAPVLFAKACEMFILEMTLRSWNYSENNKRKTLQKEDVKEAIQRTDIFDFLVDVIH